MDDSFPCHSDGRLVFSKVSYTTGAGYAAVAVFEGSLRSREPSNSRHCTFAGYCNPSPLSFFQLVDRRREERGEERG